MEYVAEWLMAQLLVLGLITDAKNITTGECLENEKYSHKV